MKLSVSIAVLAGGLFSCSPSQRPEEEEHTQGETDSDTAESFENAITILPSVNGPFTATRFVDSESLSGDRLKFSYGQMHDSGVIVERISRNGVSKWRAEVFPLGVAHSEYYNTAEVDIDRTKNEAVVTSVGFQSIVERIDLRNGRQVSRELHENGR